MGSNIQQDNVWRAVLGEIELTVSHGNFVTWFKTTQLLSVTDDVVVVGAKSFFIKNQLEHKYHSLILEKLRKNGLNPTRVDYKIQASNDTPKKSADEPVILQSLSSSKTKPSPKTQPKNSVSQSYRQNLNEKYVFDDFIVGSGNELAFAACQAVAAQPGTKYNPLYLYGGVGIGKTHLMQAAGNAIAAKTPGATVLYISTEQFVQEFVQALRERRAHEFANHYRSADVLIIDDVQFIAGKEKMQEEFFHTFNALHQSNKQIILSSDRPPRDIPTLEDRLQSRFAWGMTIDMQIPDFETRCAIVQTKANHQDMELPVDVVEYLATNIATNIRELEGALNRLLAVCEMRGLEPNLGIASSLLGSIKNRPKHLSAKQIIERTARHFQIPLEDILGPKRDKDIVVPRQVAMYMLREELHLSFPKIARELGRKDHTTAIHSVEKITKESHFDMTIKDAITEIKEHLYA